jgi:hypothetical protein
MDAEGAEDNMSSSEGKDKQDAVEEQYNELDDLSRIGHSMESDIALLDKAFGGGEYDQVYTRKNPQVVTNLQTNYITCLFIKHIGGFHYSNVYYILP